VGGFVAGGEGVFEGLLERIGGGAEGGALRGGLIAHLAEERCGAAIGTAEPLDAPGLEGGFVGSGFEGCEGFGPEVFCC
jgi:hypothetical protein